MAGPGEDLSNAAARGRRLLRRAVVAALLVALVAFVASQFTTFQRFTAVLGDASWQWFLISVVLHVVFFGVFGWMYHYGFEAADVPIPTLALVPVVFAAMFAKTIVPMEGAGFAAVLVGYADRHHQSGARAAAVTLVVTIIDLVMVLPFVLVGMLVLERRGTLAEYDIAGVALYVAVLVLFGGALWLGAVRPVMLRGVLRRLASLTNRLARLAVHRPVLAEGWAGRNARQFAAAAHAMAGHPVSAAKVAAVSTLLHLLNIAGLATIFVMFGQPVALDVLVTTFAMGTVFYVISITPQGVGTVEGGTALVLGALGMGGSLAISVTLVYRAMNVWIPAAIGIVAARRLAALPPSEPEPPERE